MGAEDDKFLRGMSEKAAGFYPGLPDRIDELNYGGYGRAITGGVLPNEKIIGYILPLTEQQTRHLVVFKDGTMLVIEPGEPGVGIAEALQEYQANFSPNPQGFWIAGTMNEAVNVFTRGYLGKHKIRTVLRNDYPGNLPEIDEAVNQALILATRLKEKREQARRESVDRLIQKIDTFLNPPRPSVEPPPNTG